VEDAETKLLEQSGCEYHKYAKQVSSKSPNKMVTQNERQRSFLQPGGPVSGRGDCDTQIPTGSGIMYIKSTSGIL
jgi:hypothetical protein